MEFLFFAALGWWGTRYPGWWKSFRKSKPQPIPWKPETEPWFYVVISAVGIGVGVASGLSFSNTIANNAFFAGRGLIASGLFSFAASNLLTGIASLLMKTQNQ
ncbi:hypothetical protein [Flavobacterium humi]|uniref:Uncharacterized protein n=1 Tax=Flavobacterium humi TaxID=2562683 RepID=A0A4Z0LD51_9FLAO|nr:hypothetical protein [Flavobacterium humi]TGD59819.1 hypothetical protein E4635_02495 [Flavobacterium humi]